MAWILDICSSANLCSAWDPCIAPSNKIKLDLKNSLPSESFLYRARRGLMQDEIVGEIKTHTKWINGGIIHILEGKIIMRSTNQSAKFLQIHLQVFIWSKRVYLWLQVKDRQGQFGKENCLNFSWILVSPAFYKNSRISSYIKPLSPVTDTLKTNDLKYQQLI